MSGHRRADIVGWILYGVGTALADHITAISMAIVGGGILIGNMCLKIYRDYLSARREDERERIMLGIERDHKISELQVEVVRLKHEVFKSKYPYAIDGQTRCAKEDDETDGMDAGQAITPESDANV